MKNQSDLKNYQRMGVRHIEKNPYCGLFKEMGLGKTVTTLTAVNKLREAGEIKKILVIAPNRVASYTWPNEVKEWSHLKHLKVLPVTGTEKRRIVLLNTKADVHTISRDLVKWIVSHYKGHWPFDCVIIDESSSFKNKDSARFKSLKMVRPQMKRVIALTGTPRPNSILDLWSQLYLLDRGERLGQKFTEFRGKYFKEDKRNQNQIFSYKLKKGENKILGEDIYEKEIYEKISDICISMQAKDWLELPKVSYHNVDIELDNKSKSLYEKFEREAVLQFAEQEISAVNAAALNNKLLQFANGAAYLENSREYVTIHDQKLDALEEILEALDGEPTLCFYSFKHDVERIFKRLKRFSPRLLKDNKDLDAWNAGDVSLLVMHSASGGHGLNMQHGGHNIQWFGLQWSLELYLQANARLPRPGQKFPVKINRLRIKDSMDIKVSEALDRKETGQESMLRATKAVLEKYGIRDVKFDRSLSEYQKNLLGL